MKIATQTLSKSVALAVSFLRQLGLDFFADSEGTSFFLLLFDELIDVFDRHSLYGKGSKAPINADNLMQKIHVLLRARGYILCMTTITDECVGKGRKSFFAGFLSSINSLINMCLELFGPDRIETSLVYLLTYKLSQDHLELLFSSFRAYMRFNNNPNALQFSYAMRAMGYKVGLTPSIAVNVWVQDDSELLCAPVIGHNANALSADAAVDQVFEETDIDINTIGLDMQRLSAYVEDVTAYIAG